MWVLGGYQSDFARNLAREGVGIDGLVREVVEGTLTSAGLPGSRSGSSTSAMPSASSSPGRGTSGRCRAAVREAARRSF